MDKIKIIKDTPNGDQSREQNVSRMDIIGQNGNTGLHYEYEDDDAISFIEEHYPETAKEFQRIQFEQYETFCKKQMDYGPSNISMGTGVGSSVNVDLSLTALVVRINDKIQRLLNLIVTNKREAQNEPIEDAFKDLSVYGIIAQIVKNGKWGI